MELRWLVASLHLVALAVGVSAIVARARGLADVAQGSALRRIFVADAWWGVAAVLWLVTGLWRAFGGLEKGTAFYLQHPLFHAKLGLFGLVFALEVWPMVTLIRWRLAARRGLDIDTSSAPALARISFLQAAVVLAMVFLATAVARGLGV